MQNKFTYYLFIDSNVNQIGGSDGKKIMAKNFKQVLVSNCHLPLSNLKEILEQSFKNWICNLEQLDDICDRR